MTRRGVYLDIDIERMRQDQQWGGPAHDDTHAAEDWLEHLSYQYSRACAAANRGTLQEQRERFVKIGALAVAAIESIDSRMLAACATKEPANALEGKSVTDDATEAKTP